MRCAERRVAAGVALFVTLAWAPGPARGGAAAPVERQRYAMGTVFTTVVHHLQDLELAARAADAALAEVARLDDVLSHYKAESDLSRLTREAAGRVVEVEPSLYEVLDASLVFARRSGGRFDTTIGPLLRAWKDARAEQRRPTGAELARAARCVSHEHIALEPPNRVRLGSDCLELDLGGIGKGYAVDRAMRVLVAAGIRHALVNAGGSTIAGMGRAPGHDGWPVELAASVEGRRMLLRDEAMSTSQQALSRLPFARGEFGEIIDPGQRAPVATGAIVSVLAPTATEADAWSTTLLLSGIEEGKALLAPHPSVSAFWMSPDGELQDAVRRRSERDGAPGS
jgi:FAD:protein FMN transferase